MLSDYRLTRSDARQIGFVDGSNPLGVFSLARHEVDREDLIAEATALVERAELRLPGFRDVVVAGFRRTGNWSVYFGPDPVYHFTAGGALRRAFVDGDLYASRGVILSRLRRARTESEVQLQRHDLTPDELHRFLAALAERLARLLSVLQAGSADVVRQVPPEADVAARLLKVVTQAQPPRLSPAIRK